MRTRPGQLTDPSLGSPVSLRIPLALRRLDDSGAGLLIRAAFIFNACLMCFGCFTTLSDSAAGHVPSISPGGGNARATADLGLGSTLPV